MVGSSTNNKNIDHVDVTSYTRQKENGGNHPIYSNWNLINTSLTINYWCHHYILSGKWYIWIFYFLHFSVSEILSKCKLIKNQSIQWGLRCGKATNQRGMGWPTHRPLPLAWPTGKPQPTAPSVRSYWVSPASSASRSGSVGLGHIRWLYFFPFAHNPGSQRQTRWEIIDNRYTRSNFTHYYYQREYVPYRRMKQRNTRKMYQYWEI